MEDLITTKFLISKLSRSAKSIQRDVKKGMPRVILPSGSVRYRLSEIEAWIAKHNTKLKKKGKNA
ncbi:MAG TPA: hypothetical protein DEE98_04565 [Elusimicrobia bacterium]|nr:MAG: hypothetical protein A2278_04255 [Elusimicrobia bacterium RIFOXYA12_FULL_49_49]OGS09777.1 MAG: hypothetical protein A2204_01235 [Elusimicrobia bacterium RIFOXYA1_FULL_47_7]OGS10513.1 MAG: hypothetical protein A2386_05415 [Elusimicrobia bacterium RIFOXYB1_FULL_48_9]OGS14737.1 MAG: hypothetical protein A2251_09590 [Elusimicrobia bacterium RIFOXYA2_FULL_47_53]OGS25611.1 MAG: hypothetical protein A2339_06000 [Elusimicrobia bacterium RIFOXYB12_FULL_50_12]OGS31828.1 MAG: hypothetical protein